MCSLEGLKGSFKLLSEEWINSLLSLIESRKAPLTGLALGVLITSSVQSSSAVVATTMVSMAGLVASGLPLSSAVSFGVPMVLGANIGTTITNTIVAIGVKRGMTEEEFNASIPGVIVDDVVKFLNVALFFILEITTGFLTNIITYSVSFLEGVFELESFFQMFERGIIDILIEEPIIRPIFNATRSIFGSELSGIILLVTCFLGIILSLSILEKSIESVLQFPEFEQRILSAFKNSVKSFAMGLFITFIVGSSSIATSLIIPFLATRMVELKDAYPYIMGTAIGTTIDLSQIYGYIAGGVTGMTLGMAHIILNVFGAIIWWLLPLSTIPINIAMWIGQFIGSHSRSYLYLIGFVATIFFIAPLIIIIL